MLAVTNESSGLLYGRRGCEEVVLAQPASREDERGGEDGNCCYHVTPRPPSPDEAAIAATLTRLTVAASLMWPFHHRPGRRARLPHLRG